MFRNGKKVDFRGRPIIVDSKKKPKQAEEDDDIKLINDRPLPPLPPSDKNPVVVGGSFAPPNTSSLKRPKYLKQRDNIKLVL